LDGEPSWDGRGSANPDNRKRNLTEVAAGGVKLTHADCNEPAAVSAFRPTMPSHSIVATAACPTRIAVAEWCISVDPALLPDWIVYGGYSIESGVALWYQTDESRLSNFLFVGSLYRDN
jgi:hypothetical protein